MMEIRGISVSKASLRHHQLSPSYSKRQNENISALVTTRDAYVKHSTLKLFSYKISSEDSYT